MSGFETRWVDQSLRVKLIQKCPIGTWVQCILSVSKANAKKKSTPNVSPICRCSVKRENARICHQFHAENYRWKPCQSSFVRTCSSHLGVREFNVSFLKNLFLSLPALKVTRVRVNLARSAPPPKTEALSWQISRSGVLVSGQRPWILETVTYKRFGEATYCMYISYFFIGEWRSLKWFVSLLWSSDAMDFFAMGHSQLVFVIENKAIFWRFWCVDHQLFLVH